MKGVVTESLSGHQRGSGDGEAGEPAAIDEEDDIWEVEALLAKWRQGRSVLYLVKWKGFSDEANSWEKRKDISTKLVDKFDVAYSEYGGNHLGVGHNVVVATCPPGLSGNVNASRVAGPMFKTFANIRMAVLVGIGGGVPRCAAVG